MFMVLGSLIYFYAYVDGRMDFMSVSVSWQAGLSKSVVFYSGLGFLRFLTC